jgi:hypothetical protein
MIMQRKLMWIRQDLTLFLRGSWEAEAHEAHEAHYHYYKLLSVIPSASNNGLSSR